MSYWYLASAYSKHPRGRECAFAEVCAQAAFLMEAGVPVFCAIAHSHPVESYLSPTLDTHDFWMAVDTPLMRAACGLIVCTLDGWETSRGVQQEIATFKQDGKPIVYMTPGEVPSEVLPRERRLLAFSGYAGSGKDTAAQALTDLGWERVAFADAVREALLALNPMVHANDGPGRNFYWECPIRKVHERYEGDWEGLKKLPEIRRLLQRLGTEAGRNIHGPDCWTNIARRKIEAAGGPVVITDCRFANEAAMVRGMGGRVIRIDRPGVGPKNDHASERLDFDPDFTICNSGTVAELHERVLELAEVKEAVA